RSRNQNVCRRRRPPALPGAHFPDDRDAAEAHDGARSRQRIVVFVDAAARFERVAEGGCTAKLPGEGQQELFHLDCINSLASRRRTSLAARWSITFAE